MSSSSGSTASSGTLERKSSKSSAAEERSALFTEQCPSEAFETLRLDEWCSPDAKLPPCEFDASGIVKECPCNYCANIRKFADAYEPLGAFDHGLPNEELPEEWCAGNLVECSGTLSADMEPCNWCPVAVRRLASSERYASAGAYPASCMSAFGQMDGVCTFDMSHMGRALATDDYGSSPYIPTVDPYSSIYPCIDGPNGTGYEPNTPVSTVYNCRYPVALASIVYLVLLRMVLGPLGRKWGPIITPETNPFTIRKIMRVIFTLALPIFARERCARWADATCDMSLALGIFALQHAGYAQPDTQSADDNESDGIEMAVLENGTSGAEFQGSNEYVDDMRQKRVLTPVPGLFEYDSDDRPVDSDDDTI